MELKNVISEILNKAYALLPPKMNSKEATVMLLSIGLQESKFQSRQQLIAKVVDGVKKLVPAGPAVSFWQFEKGKMGGIAHVLTHRSSSKHAKAICDHFGVAFDDASVWEAMKTNDVLGACMARLLLLTDPRPLPALESPIAAWDCYLRNWHPGKPHPETWPGYYKAALKAVQG